MSEATESDDSRPDNQGDVPEKLRKPHEKPVQRILRVCWDRLNRNNEHFMMALVGREGSGKSYTAIKIADELDEGFTDDQVIFRAAEFLRLLRDEEYRPGAVYVLDEAGVSFGNRTWQDRAQVLANQALQLIRSHNVGLIFTLPRLGELDTQTEGRLQAFYEIEQKVAGKYVQGGWKWIDPDRTNTTGENYHHFPKNDRGQRILSIGFSPPREELVEPYEERKTVFQREMYDEAIDELEDDDGDDELSTRDIAEEIREGGVGEYIRKINNGKTVYFDRNAVEAEYEIGARRSKKVKSLLADDLPEDAM